MVLPSQAVFDCGRSLGVGIVGVNGPCSQLPGWQLRCWAVKLSCPKAAYPVESCSDRDLLVFPSRMLHRHCLPLNKLPFISISPSSWACSCPLQQEEDLYGLDRAIHAGGKAFPYPFLQLHGSSGRLCSTGNSMVTGRHKFLSLWSAWAGVADLGSWNVLVIPKPVDVVFKGCDWLPVLLHEQERWFLDLPGCLSF